MTLSHPLVDPCGHQLYFDISIMRLQILIKISLKINILIFFTYFIHGLCIVAILMVFCPKGGTLLKHGNILTRSFDGGSRSLDRVKLIPDASGKDNVPTNTCDHNLISETNGTHMESANGTLIGNTKPEHEDYVSGMLYDMLQKEVVSEKSLQ